VRRFGALYALAFLAFVAIAPHRHLNSFEDLLLDGPSDSGVLVESRSSGACEGREFVAARLIDDDPCLACFHDDYTASAAPLFVLIESFRPLPLRARPPAPTPRDPVPEFPASRSPPNEA
jgi:hypothetical protein